MDERLDDRLTGDSTAPRHQQAGEATGDAIGSSTVSTACYIQQPTQRPVCRFLLFTGPEEISGCQDSMALHLSTGQPRCSGGRAGAGEGSASQPTRLKRSRTTEDDPELGSRNDTKARKGNGQKILESENTTVVNHWLDKTGKRKTGKGRGSKGRHS